MFLGAYLLQILDFNLNILLLNTIFVHTDISSYKSISYNALLIKVSTLLKHPIENMIGQKNILLMTLSAC